VKKGFFVLITLFFAITAYSQQKNSFQQEDSSHQIELDIQQYLKKRAHLNSKIIIESLNSVYRQSCFGTDEISESQLKMYNDRIILLTRIKENILRDTVKTNNH
jgi:hypothetical protein